jgi:hypothetical protein
MRVVQTLEVEPETPETPSGQDVPQPASSIERSQYEGDAVARSLLARTRSSGVSQGVAGEALASPPRPLLHIEAELLFFKGQFLLHHKDEAGESQYKLLSGSALRGAFAGQSVDSGWLPQGLVRWGDSLRGTYAVQWIAPRRCTIQVDAATLDVPMPGFVFMGLGETYWVWAAHGLEFNPQALAFSAPLPNLYPDGRVCWGENRALRCDAQSIEKAWEMFINSPFNGDLVAEKSKKFPNDIRGQLEKQAATGRKRATEYPLNDLERLKIGWREMSVTTAVEHILDWARGKDVEGMTGGGEWD